MITNNNCQRYRRGHFCPFRSSYCLLPTAHPSGGTAPVGCVGPTLSQRRWFEEVSQELLPHFFPSSMMMLIHCYLSVCRSLYLNHLFYCSSSIHPSIPRLSPLSAAFASSLRGEEGYFDGISSTIHSHLCEQCLL